MEEAEWIESRWKKCCLEKFKKLPGVKRESEITQYITKQSLEIYY